MIQILRHNFRFLTNVVVLIGLLFTATQCSPTATPIAQETPPGDSPEIAGFTLFPAGPMLPGTRIDIQVNVKRNGHMIDDYRWVVGAGEGNVVSGQGTPLMTYEAPNTPGFYGVHVELEYEGGPPVVGSTEVEVLPEPTPTSTGTSTPTDTPSPNTPTFTATPAQTPKPDAVVNTEALNLRSGPGVGYDVLGVLTQGDPLRVTGKNLAGDWLKVVCPGGQEGWIARSLLQVNVDMAGVLVAQNPPTPTQAHTPTPTVVLTPELLPPPIPLEPENGASFIGGPVILKWQWDRPRASDEIFSVRVYREGETEPCHHDQARDLEYWGDFPYCRAGKHYWSVALIRRVCSDVTDARCWQNLSEPSAERWIYYIPGKEPWTWPTPAR